MRFLPIVFMRYSKVPKVTTLVTFGFSSLRYFQRVATFRYLKRVLHMGRFH